MSDEEQFDAWYSKGEELGLESINVRIGSFDDGRTAVLDIRDAVYLRYLLDGAIGDYEKAVGR